MSNGRATCHAIKAKNLLILYDAVGTLADSVGADSAMAGPLTAIGPWLISR